MAGVLSEDDLREDEELFRKMAFLKESKISVSGSGSSRDFAFHLRSNPIPIVKVTVHGYGLLAGLAEADIPALGIHIGDTYSASRLNEQAASLKKAYEQEDRQLKLFTNVGISTKGEATLDFSLVAYPDDIVYVGGKAYDVTSKWDGPYVLGKSRNRKLAHDPNSLRNRGTRRASRKHAFHKLAILQNGNSVHEHELYPVRILERVVKRGFIDDALRDRKP